MIFSLFFLMISISQQAINCMEAQNSEIFDKSQFGIIFEEFKIPANQRLTQEERTAIRPDQYKENIEQAHTALRSFTHHLITLAQEQKSITFKPENQTAFEEYIINLRDGSLGLKPITVVDEITAIALATSKLNDKKKKSLQKEEFCLNQSKAHETLIYLGEETYKAFKKNNLKPHLSAREYVKNFVIRKMDELSKSYGISTNGISTICLTFSNGEIINFNNLEDLYTCLKIAGSEKN